RDFHVTGVQTCALPIYGYSITNRHFLPSGRVSSELAASVQSIRCFVDVGSNKAAESEPSPAPGARRQASVFETGIQGVAQAVAQQVEAQHHQHDGQARERSNVRRRHKVLPAATQNGTPIGLRRLRAEAEKAE